MSERRAIPRKKSFLQGRIYFNNRRASVDCVIRDVSEVGARLKFSDAVATPDVIDLYVPNKDETYRAQVKWRRGAEMGVTFVRPDAPVGAPTASVPATDLAGRVQQIENEVAHLRRIIAELRADLRQFRGED